MNTATVTSLILPVFFSGILTFFAPCTFPLLPVYLSIVIGGDNESSVLKTKLINSMSYVLGFSLVFIFLGSLASIIIHFFPDFKRVLSILGGIIIIIFGMTMLGVFKVGFLNRTIKPNIQSKFKIGTPQNAFILGASIALGWTPCVGPILGSVLLLTSTTSTIFQGMLLLTVFSVGLSIPFILFALGYNSLQRLLPAINKLLPVINILSGILLLLMGILLLFDKFSVLISIGLVVFEKLGLEKFLSYL